MSGVGFPTSIKATKTVSLERLSTEVILSCKKMTFKLTIIIHVFMSSSFGK